MSQRPPETKEWEEPWNELLIDVDAIRDNYVVGFDQEYAELWQRKGETQ